jgi:hypothetical protein
VEFPQFPVFNTDEYLIIRPILVLVGERRPATAGKGSLRERRSEGRATFTKIVRKLHRMIQLISRLSCAIQRVFDQGIRMTDERG